MSWPMVKLGSLVIDERSGASLTRDEFADTGVAVVPKKAISESVDLLEETLVYTSREKFIASKSAHVSNRYLITTLRNLNPDGSTLGLICRNNVSGEFMLAQGVHAFLFDERVDLNYICYASRQPKFRAAVQRVKVGSTQVHMRARELKDIEIPLPPLSEQNRIAAILDKADAIRRKRQQAIQLADDFLRAVFLDMFGDPVTNPKGWEVKSLGQISNFENGDRSSNYPSGDDLVSEGVLFLSTKNIVSDTLNLESCQYITEEKYIALSRGKARKGDLIITLRGTLGSCCIFDCEHEKAFINAQMMIIRPDSDVGNIFLHDLLVSKAIKSHLQGIGQGAAVPQLTAKQLKDLMLPIPPIQEQMRYENIRGSVLASIKKMQSESEVSLFKAIAKKAFSGPL